MLAEFDYSCETEGSPLSEGQLSRLCAFVLEKEQVDVPCAVSLTLVDDERMAELNHEWRGVDRATDVLSLECERPDEAVGLCELGDIVLAPAFIAAQAPHFGNSAAGEMCLLVIHGMLHLLGYDHLEDAEAEVMEAREDALLAEFTDGEAVGGTVTRHRPDQDGASL